MELRDCRFNGKDACKLEELPCDGDVSKSDRKRFEAATAANLKKMAALQDKFYADGREGMIVLLQAMDAAGKDSTIKHVMSGVNPQGVEVTNFKAPSSEELSHDYLWRANNALPPRGKIAIFNRSHYEDVLVVRVHEMQKGYKMPARCIDEDTGDFFERRYRQIRDWEQYLYENGYRFVKIFLHESKDEQKKRFLDRIDDESKNWKFSSADVKERGFWDSYMKAYEDAINATATKESPWYVIPADRKWFTRYLVSEAVVDALEACDPHYPEMSGDSKGELEQCKQQLLSEGDGHAPSAGAGEKD